MAKKSNKGQIAPCAPDCAPTPERRQKLGGVSSEAIYQKSDGKTYIRRHRAIAECTLDHYLYLDKITPLEHEAGMIFGQAYQRAVLKIRVDDTSDSYGDKEMGFLVYIQSEQLMRQAYKALSNAQKTLIINVCGDGYGVGDTNRLKTFKRGLGKLIKLWKLR